jgi:hypothetical protein
MKMATNFNFGWEPYDPQWLIDLALEQHKDKMWLIDAFSKCTNAKSGGSAYIYFVDGSNPNQSESEWQFDQNLMMQSFDQGEIIVDILRGNRIGGIEFTRNLS